MGNRSKRKKKSKKEERTHSDKELMRMLWDYITPFKNMFYILVILMLINVAFGISAPLLYQKAMALIEEESSTEMQLILPPLIGYFIILMTQWFSRAIHRFYSYRFSASITNNIRNHVFGEVLRNKLDFFHKTESGRLTSTITNDIAELSNTGDRFVYVTTNLVRLFAILGVLFYFSRWLTFSALIFMPILFVIIFFMRGYTRKVSRKWRKNWAIVNQNISESMRSIQVCKAFNREAENVKKMKDLNEETYRSSVRRGFAIFIVGPVSDLFRHLLTIVILLVGTLEHDYRPLSFTVSVFFLFLFLLDYYYYPVLSLARNLNSFQSAFAILDRILKITENKQIKEVVSGNIRKEKFTGEIEFKNVNFSYIADTPVIKNMSFLLKPGQRVALVGHTGSGKTTIASLLVRFYDIESGEIDIDGLNIKSYSLDDLRARTGLVNQRVLLIKGTIRENLKLGNDDATDEEIWNALDAVQAREFIESVGLDFEVSDDGKNLSAGQRQMISYARVLLTNPDIIILDEATSAVDLYTESKIQDATDLLLLGKSSIVIAHRLTTILKSDYIIVLDNGKIVQKGTHAELVEIPGEYQEMYKLYFETQSAKYLEVMKTS
jgi:ATP-binding cassette subfamily B protein